MHWLRMRKMTGKMNRTPRRGQGSCRTATSSCTSYRRFAELHQKILKLLDVVSGSKMGAIKQKDQCVGYSLAWDDVSGEELDVEEMKVARKKKKKKKKKKRSTLKEEVCGRSLPRRNELGWHLHLARPINPILQEIA